MFYKGQTVQTPSNGLGRIIRKQGKTGWMVEYSTTCQVLVDFSRQRYEERPCKRDRFFKTEDLSIPNLAEKSA
jgi:hypothetical protein